MKNKYILLGLLLIITNQNVFAIDIKTLKEIKIFHLNGVNTSQEDALDNMQALRNVTNIKSNFITWDVIYNPTHGHLMRDLLDTFKLKSQEGQDPTLDDFVKTYMKSFKLDYPEGSDEYKKLREKIKELYLKNKSFAGLNFKAILRQYHDKVPPPYKSIVELLRKAKANGDNPYVLLLPHSQGVQYSNQLWRYITEIDDFPKDNIRVFAVASPANHINGGMRDGIKKPYVTAKNDRVINGLRAFASLPPISYEPLAGNVTLNCGDAWLCHGLTTDYLVDRTTKIMIKNRIRENIIFLYVNLIQKEIDDQNTFVFTDFLKTDLEYQLIDSSSGKILCDDGKCDPSLKIYELNLGIDTSGTYFEHKFGNLLPGSYLVTSKTPRIPGEFITYFVELGGYFTKFKTYNYGGGVGNCKDTGWEYNLPHWRFNTETYRFYCDGPPPAEALYDNKLILFKFDVGQ